MSIQVPILQLQLAPVPRPLTMACTFGHVKVPSYWALFRSADLRMAGLSKETGKGSAVGYPGDRLPKQANCHSTQIDPGFGLRASRDRSFLGLFIIFRMICKDFVSPPSYQVTLALCNPWKTCHQCCLNPPPPALCSWSAHLTFVASTEIGVYSRKRIVSSLHKVSITRCTYRF